MNKEAVMKKKLVALLAVAGLALVGCATDPASEGGSSSEEKKEEGGDIVLQIGVEEGYHPYFQEVADAYTEEHPEVTFEIVQTSMFDLLDALETQQGNSADIFMMPNDRIGDLADKKLIAPTDADLTGYTEAAQTASNYNGENYIVPLSTDTTLLYYNKANVSEEPETLKEIPVEEWTAKYTDFYVAGGMLASNGGYIFGDDTSDIGLNNAGSVKALTAIQELFHNGSENWVAMQEDTSGYDWQVQAFIDGTINYYIDGPWKYADLVKGGLAEENIGYMPIPSWDGSGTYAPITGVKGLVANANSEHVEVAQDFVSTFATGEYAQKWYESYNEVNPHTEVVFEEGSIAEVVSNATSVGTAMPTDPAFSKVWEPMADALKQVAVDKNVDPKEALDAAVATIQADIAAME